MKLRLLFESNAAMSLFIEAETEAEQRLLGAGFEGSRTTETYVTYEGHQSNQRVSKVTLRLERK